MFGGVGCVGEVALGGEDRCSVVVVVGGVIQALNTCCSGLLHLFFAVGVDTSQ